MTNKEIYDSEDNSIYQVRTKDTGPTGCLPLTPEILSSFSSGHLYGMTQDAGMGWDPSELLREQYLILSHQGGIRAEDGKPIALGYHTGHWELELLMKEAAIELRRLGVIPYAGYCTDPCDGRTQGTPGMMDSLAYRNEAAILLRRLIRSLPRCSGVMMVACCDKALPAAMMAIASMSHMPCIVVPGGVTLPPLEGEDTAKVQSIGARFAKGEISLEYASEVGCRACASAGGACHFLGTAATSQVVAEALGLALTHSALAPSGQKIWLDIAKRSAKALINLKNKRIYMKDILTEDSIWNAMILHSAFGGSTNLLLHIPAIAHSAGLRRPTIDDWIEVNAKVPRLVDALPNGPVGHPTVRVFLAGGVPEVMLHLWDMGLLRDNVMTVTGETLARNLEWWQRSERRKILKDKLFELDSVDPNEVIMSPKEARSRGLTSTITFPVGNIAPEGSVIKSTAIDPTVIDSDGVYRMTGRARVFTRESDVMRAIKSSGDDQIRPGDVIVLCCRGPMGAGMEEIFQVTSALRYLSYGKYIAVITDARFSGVSTGACIGHVSPEALAGGPIGKLLDGDLIQIIIDRKNLKGTVDLVGHGDIVFGAEQGKRVLESRKMRQDLRPDDKLPSDTKLWAALQHISGGIWGGCVYDTDEILKKLLK